MNATIRHLYRQAREATYDARSALRPARIVAAFEEAEAAGDVRLVAEPDDRPYDPGDMCDGYTNQYGRRVSADQAKQELVALLDRTGNWGVIAHFRNHLGRWETADSIWGCAGYEDVTDWRQNWYVPDLMAAALERNAEKFVGV